MAVNYTIRGFDENNGSITVEFHDLGTWSLDLPVENGKYPEGEALETFIQGFYPSWVIERKQTLNAGISNAESIKALVNPLPVQDNPVVFAEDLANIQMWNDVDFERKLADPSLKKT